MFFFTKITNYHAFIQTPSPLQIKKQLISQTALLHDLLRFKEISCDSDLDPAVFHHLVKESQGPYLFQETVNAPHTFQLSPYMTVLLVCEMKTLLKVKQLAHQLIQSLAVKTVNLLGAITVSLAVCYCAFPPPSIFFTLFFALLTTAFTYTFFFHYNALNVIKTYLLIHKWKEKDIGLIFKVYLKKIRLDILQAEVDHIFQISSALIPSSPQTLLHLFSPSERVFILIRSMQTLFQRSFVSQKSASILLDQFLTQFPLISWPGNIKALDQEKFIRLFSDIEKCPDIREEERRLVFDEVSTFVRAFSYSPRIDTTLSHAINEVLNRLTYPSSEFLVEVMQTSRSAIAHDYLYQIFRNTLDLQKQTAPIGFSQIYIVNHCNFLLLSWCRVFFNELCAHTPLEAFISNLKKVVCERSANNPYQKVLEIFLYFIINNKKLILDQEGVFKSIGPDDLYYQWNCVKKIYQTVARNPSYLTILQMNHRRLPFLP